MSLIGHTPNRNYGWNVDPDNRDDRRNGEVVTYKLTPEELEKYKGLKPPKGKPGIGLDVMEMVRKREAKKGRGKDA